MEAKIIVMVDKEFREVVLTTEETIALELETEQMKRDYGSGWTPGMALTMNVLDKGIRDLVGKHLGGGLSVGKDKE